MTNSVSVRGIRAGESRIFILAMTLPVKLIMVQSATDCATRVAGLLSFTDRERVDLELAVEEGFSNAVKHFSRQVDDKERIHLEFYIDQGNLVVSIREKGIPFGSIPAEVYTPGNLDGMDAPGLGMLLMNKGMDSVELLVHGRQGKETRMTKKLHYGALPDELIPVPRGKSGQKRIRVDHPILRFATREDLPDICRLAWRCYGYTQEALLYDIDLLTEKFSSGELKSVVSFDPASGEMISHIALKYHDGESKVPELGLAFIDPAYRCPALAGGMGRMMSRAAEESGDSGMFDCSVTTHIYSQRAMQEEVGSSPCGLMLSIAAAGMQVKDRPVKKQEKGSIVNHYKPFDYSPKTVFVPEHHREMVSEIYRWMALPRAFGEPATGLPVGPSAVESFSLPDELNVSFIVVQKIGETTATEILEEIRKYRREGKDAVFLFLSLCNGFSPFLIEQCEEMGFSFAGVMPHIHNGDDRFLMQYVQLMPDTDRILVYGERSAKLRAYVLQEQNRVRGY